MILLLSEGFAFHVCLYDFITTSEYEDLEKEKRNFIKCIKYTNIILNAAPVPSQLLPLLQMIYWCQYVCVLCLIMCFNLKTPTRHLLAPLFDYFKLKDCPSFVDLKYFLLKGILRKNSRASSPVYLQIHAKSNFTCTLKNYYHIRDYQSVPLCVNKTM